MILSYFALDDVSVNPPSSPGLVSNLGGSQCPDTALVDLFYDLSGVGSACSVSVAVSSDGGATFTIPATHFTGDGVTNPTAPGTGKHLVWDAGADLGPGLFQSVVLRVSSEGSSATSGVFSVDLRRPWIVSQPASGQTPQAGSGVAFTVSAAGTPPLSYQWRKNGVAIPGATAATLTLNAVTAADSADYTVQVRNAYGQAESQPASLAVVDDGAQGAEPQQETGGDPIPQEPAKQNLVIVTHGFEVVGQKADWIDDLAAAIRTRLASLGKTDWQVEPLHWEDRAWGVPALALLRGGNFGALRGKAFAEQQWQQVHLIGHSAGSKVIEVIAQELRKAKVPPTTIHETFLDPFVGEEGSYRHIYGANANWADSYFSDDWTWLATGGWLEYAYNVDVTWLDPDHWTVSKLCPFNLCGQVAFSPGVTGGHAWPYEFYTQTVTGEFTCAPDVGFALSQEAGGWDKHAALGADNDPVPLCPDPDASSPPGTPKPDRVWKPIPIQDAPRGARGSWEINGNSAFALGAGTGHGLAKASTGTRGVAPMDGPSGDATASWLAVAVTITNPVNYVQFDAAFGSPAGSEGLLTVYWNTNQIGLADERVADPGLQNYRFALPAAVTNGLYTLSFRLDAFHATSSSITVTNVTTGFYGLLEAPVLSLVSGETNSAPVLQVTAPAGYDCVVLNSTNLVDWAPAAVLVNTNGTAYYPLPKESAASAQFYRAVIP